MRNTGEIQGGMSSGGGFAARRVPTLEQIRALHGVSEGTPGAPAFSDWYRRSAVESFLAWNEVAQLGVSRLSELMRINMRTAGALVNGQMSRPTWRTLVKMIAAGIIDARDAAPKMDFARQLRPLGANRRRGRIGRYLNWGVAEALIAWRRTRGHTQADCHELFLACSAQMLSSWERGHALPGPRSLLRLVELHVIDASTARAIVDSDHYPDVILKQTDPAVIAAIRR